VRIRDARGDRLYRRGDFPLIAGGAGAGDVELPGFPAGAKIAVLGLAEGGLYWQSVPEAAGLDAVAQPEPRWLVPGDVLRIGSARLRCEQAGDGLRVNVAPALETGTLPPDLNAETALAEATGIDASDDGIEASAFRATRAALTRRRQRNPWSIAGAVGLFVFVAIVWFLTTSTAVQIGTDPAADSLSVEGGFAIAFSGHRLLRPGAYTVVAEKAGYEPLKAPIEVTGDNNQQFSFKLVKLPGRLNVRTAAPNAEVFVDGARAGAAPLDRFEVKPGDHVVGVKAPRYLPQEQSITIEGGGVEQSIDVTLPPGWASVTVDSTPPGAELRVDDVVAGKTPVTLDLERGERTLELKLAGFKVWSQTLTVEPGVAQQLPAVALVKADGLIDVRSVPSGATVTVDGRFRGETPLELELAPGRSYRVGLSKAGYAPVNRTLEPVSGRDTSLSVTLEGMLGIVRIATDPPDGEVYVDGAAHGRAPQSIELTAVPHRIEVRKAGYASKTSTVTPRPGFEQQVLISLQTEAVARRAAMPAQITTKLGQMLVLVTSPGKFEMGASRREPGRRANETLYEVNLQRVFYIGAKEVTNKEYRAFDAKHQSGTRDTYSLDDDAQPVVRVSWEDAARFCNWLSEKEGLPPAYSEMNGKLFSASPMTTGYRLPTEAEWTWAARYSSGAPLRYPWGQEMPPTPKSGNFADQSARATIGTVIEGYDDSYAATAPPGSFPANAIGLYDLGGNVAEWVHDLYSIEVSSGFDVLQDPMGPSIGDQHVIRGSSYLQGDVANLRLTYRDYGADSRDDLGFRIARYAE
jgi:formylglycine-generating enzyme required for sulfatase activity